MAAQRTSEGSRKKRSSFEDDFEVALDEHKIPYRYEKRKIKYLVEHTYTPDWELLKSGVLVETKGWLRPKDRTVLSHVKKQHPDLDIRVLFQRKADAERSISPGSLTSNADWLQAHGIPWAAGALPVEWTLERTSGPCRNLAVPPPGPAGDPDFTDPRTWESDIAIPTAAQRRKRGSGSETGHLRRPGPPDPGGRRDTRPVDPDPRQQAPTAPGGNPPRPKRSALSDKPTAPRRRAS